MYRQLGFLCNLFIAVTALGLSECGGKSKSQDVEITILQSNPIVFNSPLSYTNMSGTAVNLNGPWFKFQVIISNHTDTSVTIEALTLTITDNTNPGSAPTTTTFTPTTDAYTTTNDTCTFTDYGQFDPAGTSLPPQGTISATGSYNTSPLFEIPAEGSTAGCQVLIATFYASALPTTSPTQQLFSYSVQAQPVGWFGTRTTQTDRFTNYAFFTTQ